MTRKSFNIFCCGKLNIFKKTFYFTLKQLQIQFVKVKVKVTLVQALRLCTGRTAHRGSRGIALPTALEGGEGSASRPGRSLPPGKTRYQLYRRLCGPQGQSGQARKISPPPGFDPWTDQPVASRYTDWATRPTIQFVGAYKFHYKQKICEHVTFLSNTNGALVKDSRYSLM